MRNKIIVFFTILMLGLTPGVWAAQSFEWDVGKRIVEKVFKTTNPTITDDKKYRVGTVWLNITTDKAYILTDNTGGAAVWKDFSLADVDGNVDINGGTIDGVTIGGTVPALGVTTDVVKLDDTNSTDQLSLIWNENDTADRLVNILVGGGNRNFTLNENLTIGNGTDITITGEDNASTITLDNSTLEVENAAATQRLLKLVIGTDAAATLSIEGTSGGINQDVTSDASPTFTNITAEAAAPTELITWTDAGWNETGDWTFAASVLTHVTGNTTAVTGTVTGALTAGVTYKVTITGTGGTATATYTLGGVTGTTIAASGAIAITDYITATADSELVITPANTCTVALTLVSVKALTDATGDATIQGDLFVGSTIKSPGGIGGITIFPRGNVGVSITSTNVDTSLFKADRVDASYGGGVSLATASNRGKLTMLLNTGGSSTETASLLYTTGGWQWDTSLNVIGNMGVATTFPDAGLEVNSATGLGVRVTYNDSNGSAANHGDLTVGATGDVTLTATGTNPNIILTPAGTGAVQIKVVITSHGATEAVAAATLYGNIHQITGNYTVTLPAAVIGMSATFRASSAAAFSIDTNVADHFEMFDGTALDGGDKITSSGTKNEFVTIYCESANVWIIIGQNGAFTDGGA